MISKLRSLTDKIDAYHADLHVTAEAAEDLARRRDALIAELTDLGIMVTVARKEIARVELTVAWPEGKSEAERLPLRYDPIREDEQCAMAVELPPANRSTMPELPASLDRRGRP